MRNPAPTLTLPLKGEGISRPPIFLPLRSGDTRTILQRFGQVGYADYLGAV